MLKLFERLAVPVPPPISPARYPPEEPGFDWAQTSGYASGRWEPSYEPPPEFEFNQTVNR